MDTKLASIHSQFEELSMFYDYNKEDLNSADTKQKDMKFFWLKKIEQTETKIKTLESSLQKAFKNRQKIMNQTNNFNSAVTDDRDRRRLTKLSDENDSLGRAQDIAAQIGSAGKDILNSLSR